MSSIRLVEPADRDAWLRMRLALWPEDAGHHASEINAHLTGGETPWRLGAVFVAEREGGGLCGFAEAAVRPFADACEEAPCAYLEGLWVDEDRRRSGIARALVEAVEGWARENGHHELGSDYLIIENSESAKWHAAHGFEVVERLVILRKRL